VASIVADGPPPLATFAYDAAGRRTSRTLENGITSTYAYDADGQLTLLAHGSVETLTYTYDNMHRRTGEPSHLGSGAEDSRKRTRRVPMAAGSGRHQTRSSAPARTFGYDLTGQLIAVNQSTGNATFAYDAVGNRTVVTGASGAGSYTANNLNQYTTASGGALTYDANGNLATGGGATYTHTTGTDGGSGEIRRRRTRQGETSRSERVNCYGNSRMISASGPGSATASFGRDGRNRDVKRTIDGVTTYLIYDGWNLVAEYDAAGVLTTQYIHGPRVDEILAKVTPASTTFPLPDALGSTIAVTDASGAVLERVYYFDAFGTPTFRSGTGVQLPDTSTGTRFLFTGREWFARLGLYDYRNRTYSPRLGRFVQVDPIGFKAGDVNLYRYVSNEPARYTDPSGLYPTTLTTPAGIAALADAVRNGLMTAEMLRQLGLAQDLIDAILEAAKDDKREPLCKFISFRDTTLVPQSCGGICWYDCSDGSSGTIHAAKESDCKKLVRKSALGDVHDD
jgi:RHS repeat-associated protein